MHMNRKTAAAAFAVLGVGVLALSACAGGGTGTPTGSPSEPAELPLVGYEIVDPGTLAEGGTLNLAVSSDPTSEGSWNVNHADANNVDSQLVLAPTVGNLARATADGDWEPDPNYATSIELTSEEPQVVTVDLNEDAVWQDGTPITADDYKATYAALSDAATFNIIPSPVFAAIESVDVVSDYEFTVTFGETYADWPQFALTPATPAAIASDPTRFNTEFASSPAPSSGPYIFDQIDNDAKISTLVPNPLWWGENTPKLDTISFKVIAQEALPQAFANDEIDYLEIQTPDALETASGKSGAVVQRSGGVTWSHVTFNGKAAPFDDVNVRKAVASAIDRELIARVANEPLGAPATTLGDWIFMPGQTGYEDTFGETYPRDLEAAAGYLEDSGWTHGDDAWTKDGETLSFGIVVPAGTQSNINRALGVQDALAELDIEVSVDEVPATDYFTTISNGQFQAVTFGWQGTLFPIASAQAIYTPEQEFGDESGQNYSFITDDRLAPLWAEANAELDEDARLAKAKEINEVIADYVPSVPIYPYPEVVASDEGLANYGTATFLSVDWSAVGYLK